MQRIVWAGVFAATLVGFLSPSVSAADPINVNPDADAKFLNRMTIEMGGVYFYNSNTTSDGRDGWIYTSVNATCPSTISIDTDTLLPYTLSYAIKTGETCSTASTKGIGISDWEARQWTVFGMDNGMVMSTKADVKTPFKKSTVSGLSVDTYIQDVPASSCPSIVINRGGGNWEFIPVIASGPGEADSNLKAVLGSTAICRVANGGVNDPTSPSRIFNYYGLPATYGDSRYKNDFKLMNSSTTDTTTFRLEGGVVSGVGIAGAGPLATLAANVSANTSATADTETCNISGVGWIVCPVSSFIGMITDGVYAAVEQLLYFQIAPDPWDTNPALNPAYTIWSNIRNIANITFVIAFFIVIFSQATSFGISAYGIRKMLPRIIFAAIMVNLSYYICVLGVDISNIVGAGADGVLKGALNSVGATHQDGLGLSTIIATALIAGGAVWGGVAIAGMSTTALGAALLGMAITFGIAALMAILVALVVLLGRQALLIILIILSPLAFVAYILPNTENLFTKWRKAFMTMLVFYPLVTVLFAGSQVAAAVMRLASDNAFVDILSVGVQAFPLFATPFLLKFSGGVLGRVAGMVNNPNKGPFDRMRKAGAAKQDELRKRAYQQRLQTPQDQMNRIARRRFNRQRNREQLRKGVDENIKNLETMDERERLNSDDDFAARVAGSPGRVPVIRARAQAAVDRVNTEETQAHQSSLGDRVGAAALAAGFTYRDNKLYDAAGAELSGASGDQALRDATGIQSPSITVKGMSALTRDVITYGTQTGATHDRNGARAIANVLADSNGLTAHTAQQLVESAAKLTDDAGNPLQGEALQDAIQKRTYLAEHIASKAAGNPALKHLGFIGVDDKGNFDLGTKKGGIEKVIADQISAGGLGSISKEMYVDAQIQPHVGEELKKRITSPDPTVTEAFERQLTQVSEANLGNMSAALASAGETISVDDLRKRKNDAATKYQSSST